MRSIILFFLPLLFLACNNDSKEDNNILQQPPFNVFTDSIAADPSNAALYYRRGSMLYQQDQKLLAKQDIVKAWELEPSETHGLSLTTLLKEINTDSALVFLEEAVSILPGSLALRIGLARGYQQKGATDRSLSILDKVLEQYPGQLDALSMKAEIYDQLDKKSESIQYLEKAWSLAPSDPELAYELAYGYAVIKDPKALKLTDSLIRNNAPEIEKAYYSRAVYYTGIKKSNEAIKNYDAAIRANYNFADAYLEKGEMLYDLKRFDDAQRTFELALKVAPANALFFFWLGKCQEARGYKEEAKANYQRAYGLDKNFTEARDAAGKL
jgi:tetratricopeptide (TPR) repeat protein